MKLLYFLPMLAGATFFYFYLKGLCCVSLIKFKNKEITKQEHSDNIADYVDMMTVFIYVWLVITFIIGMICVL